MAGLQPPPNLRGEYRGIIDLRSAAAPNGLFQSMCFMRVAQTWEQISLLIERESEAGGLIRVHSDMASVRVGMMNGITTLRLLYTFEESTPRQDSVGTIARQYSGAATFEFRRDGEVWQVSGHFFDDFGRSGQISLRQVSPDAAAAVQPRVASLPGQVPAGPDKVADQGRVSSPLNCSESPDFAPEKPMIIEGSTS